MSKILTLILSFVLSGLAYAQDNVDPCAKYTTPQQKALCYKLQNTTEQERENFINKYSLPDQNTIPAPPPPIPYTLGIQGLPPTDASGIPLTPEQQQAATEQQSTSGIAPSTMNNSEFKGSWQKLQRPPMYKPKPPETTQSSSSSSDQQTEEGYQDIFK